MQKAKEFVSKYGVVVIRDGAIGTVQYDDDDDDDNLFYYIVQYR